jgi:hypothetical protein
MSVEASTSAGMAWVACRQGGSHLPYHRDNLRGPPTAGKTNQLRWDEALEQVGKALELGPLVSIINCNLGFFYYAEELQ